MPTDPDKTLKAAEDFLTVRDDLYQRNESSQSLSSPRK